MKKTPWLVCLLSVSAFASGGTPGEKVIYGSDDRLDLYQVQNSRDVGLADSTVALIEAQNLTLNAGKYAIAAGQFGREFGLCTDEPFFDQPSGAFCSGSLVAPDLIITAGHCIKNAGDCASTKFVFGYAVKKEGAFPTEAAAANVVGCKEIVARKQEGNGADYAVIRLDRSITNHAPLAINRANDLKDGDHVGVIGHPSGLPTKVAFGDSLVRTVNKPGYFMANLDTYGGNSGSAVFNTKTGLIEGILVRGENDFVYVNGCRKSNVCPATGCRGEDVTKIAEVAKLIPETRTNPPVPPKPRSSWPTSHRAPRE
ncbi:MAG: trypsin-like peptidase domain-containing protein [Bdellovibrionales bacterium]|nr:trypsin-like peptidase domain-containing protein [Bdellovibrionales bacterium]